MSFELDLTPRPPATRFPDAVLVEMAAWWTRYPTHRFEQTILVFPDEETKRLRLASHAAHPEKNDYLTSYVWLGDESVELSLTGGADETRWIYDFAVESLKRWDCRLSYFDEEVPPEDLLAAAED